MLAHRIIPVLLQRDGALVKGKKFKSWRSVGHALQAVKIHQARNVDELIILDIGATPNNRAPNFKLISELTDDCFLPLTVGGGVKSVDDVRRLLRAGADKVAVCTAATWSPSLITEISKELGSQCVVAAVDVSGDRIMSHCGTRGWMFEAEEWCKSCEYRGAGEILLTSIELEGMMTGYDLELIHKISHAVDIPVIANGGCGTYKHMLEAIHAGASAVAAGSMFQFTEQTPKLAAEYLHYNGVEVRYEEEKV